jgi:hypothetical protein
MTSKASRIKRRRRLATRAVGQPWREGSPVGAERLVTDAVPPPVKRAPAELAPV